MIYLSNAALKYAVDVCLELPTYKVIVCPELRAKWDYILDQMVDYIPSKDINICRILKNKSGDYYISFTNGSIIRIVPASDSSRGYRANLVVVDNKVDEDIINTVLRPIEIKQLIEKR